MATLRSAPLARTKLAINHNLQSGQHFADATAEYGGASMNVSSGKLYEPGDEAHFVGAHSAVGGQSIPTHYLSAGSDNPQLSAGRAHRERMRVFGATGGDKNVAVGSWVDSAAPTKGVQVDASSVFHDRRQAENATLHRNEDAYFSMSNMEETRNEDIRASRGMGPRPPRG